MMVATRSFVGATAGFLSFSERRRGRWLGDEPIKDVNDAAAPPAAAARKEADFSSLRTTCSLPAPTKLASPSPSSPPPLACSASCTIGGGGGGGGGC